MTTAEQYRNSALKFRANARREESPQLKVIWENRAHCYSLMAEQADRKVRAENFTAHDQNNETAM